MTELQRLENRLQALEDKVTDHEENMALLTEKHNHLLQDCATLRDWHRKAVTKLEKIFIILRKIGGVE